MFSANILAMPCCKCEEVVGSTTEVNGKCRQSAISNRKFSSRRHLKQKCRPEAEDASGRRRRRGRQWLPVVLVDTGNDVIDEETDGVVDCGSETSL